MTYVSFRKKIKLYHLPDGTTHRVRVSGGHLGNAEAPTEPAGETVPYEKNKMSLRDTAVPK